MTTNFQKLFKAWATLDVIIPDPKISNDKAISTNKGLYTALTTYISEIIMTLSEVKDLGAEIGSEDEASAIVSAKQFKNILHAQAMQNLKINSSKQARKEVFNQLKASQYLFYQVKDCKNKAYHNTQYYPVVLKHNNHVTYSSNNTLYEYAMYKRNAKYDKKQFKQLDIDAMQKIKPKVLKILRQEFNTTRYVITLNPKANDDIDEPRYVQINDTKIYYNPKKVSAKTIITYNIPHLPNDNTAYTAFGVDKNHALLQY